MIGTLPPTISRRFLDGSGRADDTTRSMEALLAFGVIDRTIMLHGSAGSEGRAMFNEAERRELAAIEDMLRADDPEFVRRFGVQDKRGRSAWIAVAALALFTAIAWTVAALRYRSVPGAVVGLVGIGAAAGICITNWSGQGDHSSGSDRRS